MNAPHEEYEIGRLLPVVNEASLNAARVVRQLRRLDIPVAEPIFTRFGDLRYTQDELYVRARYGDVIGSVSGDGGLQKVVAFMMGREAQEELPKVPLVAFRGGNACDVAMSLTGRDEPARILRKGRIMTVNPMEIQLREPGKPTTIIHELGYLSIGSSVLGAESLDGVKSSHPLLQTIVQPFREVSATVGVMKGYRPFIVRCENGEAEELTNFIVARSANMAKHGRTQVTLSQPQIEIIRSRAVRAREVVGDMVKFAAKRLRGEVSSGPACFTVESADGAPLEWQVAGDSARMASGTSFTVGLARQGIHMLTTRYV